MYASDARVIAFLNNKQGSALARALQSLIRAVRVTAERGSYQVTCPLPVRVVDLRCELIEDLKSILMYMGYEVSVDETSVGFVITICWLE